MDITADRLKILKARGFNPKTIIDCGAYNGAWAGFVKDIFPDSFMFSIEANDEHTAELVERKNNGQIDEYVFNYILGNECKSGVDFYCNTGENSGNSIYKELSGCFRDECCYTKKLEMITLDALLPKHKLEHRVDLIKLDVQGSELDVLSGASNIINNNEPIIIMEVSLVNYNKDAPQFYEVMEYMKYINYVVFDITEFHYFGHNLGHADMIFVHARSEYVYKPENN